MLTWTGGWLGVTSASVMDSPLRMRLRVPQFPLLVPETEVPQVRDLVAIG